MQPKYFKFVAIKLELRLLKIFKSQFDEFHLKLLKSLECIRRKFAKDYFENRLGLFLNLDYRIPGAVKMKELKSPVYVFGTFPRQMF